MKIKENFQDRYLTATTRKTNYQDIIFAKITLWASEKDYDQGNCMGAISINNILVNDKKDIYKAAHKLLKGR